MASSQIIIPANVPVALRETFTKNYNLITKNTDRFFLFVCDHKMEHLNIDFCGAEIPEEVGHPEHLFKIAQSHMMGAFATHLGLIDRYGLAYPTIPYIVKLSVKTNTAQPPGWWQKIQPYSYDPMSQQLWHVQDVIALQEEHNLSIPGVGITIYLGSVHESIMLEQAAQMIYQAHQHGLVAIVWAYARGALIQEEDNPAIIAGAAGVAASLGADFVKVKQPTDNLHQVIVAAGNTGVICAGGSKEDDATLLQQIYDNLQNGARGCAVGRNIFQRKASEAINLSKAIADIVYKNKTPQEALSLYHV